MQWGWLTWDLSSEWKMPSVRCGRERNQPDTECSRGVVGVLCGEGLICMGDGIWLIWLWPLETDQIWGWGRVQQLRKTKMVMDVGWKGKFLTSQHRHHDRGWSSHDGKRLGKEVCKKALFTTHWWHEHTAVACFVPWPDLIGKCRHHDWGREACCSPPPQMWGMGNSWDARWEWVQEVRKGKGGNEVSKVIRKMRRWGWDGHWCRWLFSMILFERKGNGVPPPHCSSSNTLKSVCVGV